jgi:uncharacterized lipoprotein YmbA
MTVRRSTLLFALLLMLASGCGFFSRPKNQFYSLTTIPSTNATWSDGLSARPPVGIDAIELPPGLDRRGVVVRDADHKVEVRGAHQWTAPLEEMVLHTIAFDLANRLPEGMVVLPGQTKPAGAMRSISVVFEELAPGPEPLFVLDARWTVTDNATKVTHHERIPITMASMDSAEIAAAMSRALATLADRMATALR